VPDHLGGYVSGGDPATYFPEVWDDLGRYHRSVIDVGCGDGAALAYFRGLGCEVLGVEGVPQDDPDIVLHDYTAGPYVPDRTFDLCWSCEFVEHVDERYVPNFLETFRAARTVVMTHAFPGQPGQHHVNCQPPEYWVAMMLAAGFELDRERTLRLRSLAMGNTYLWWDGFEVRTNHFLRSGLAFARRSASDTHREDQ